MEGSKRVVGMCVQCGRNQGSNGMTGSQGKIESSLRWWTIEKVSDTNS